MGNDICRTCPAIFICRTSEFRLFLFWETQNLEILQGLFSTVRMVVSVNAPPPVWMTPTLPVPYRTVPYSTEILILVPVVGRSWLFNGASAESMQVRFLLLSFCLRRLDFTHYVAIFIWAYNFAVSPHVIGVCSCSEGGKKRWVRHLRVNETARKVGMLLLPLKLPSF